jgi:two-component system LytT family response regulator
MLRVLIVDDERLARVALRALLEERGDVEVVGEADGVRTARVQLEALQPDVVFLDVQMSGSSGFELFEGVVQSKVIFCTAYEQYAVRAFEVNALDYLVKPVRPEGVERALTRLRQGTDVGQESGAALRHGDLVALREAHGLRFVKVTDISHLQAADDYSEVHLINGTSALVHVPLRRWELRLPATDFARIHRSFLVNLSHVDGVRQVDGAWHVVLRHGLSLSVSRRMAGDVKKRL